MEIPQKTNNRSITRPKNSHWGIYQKKNESTNSKTYNPVFIAAEFTIANICK